MRQPTPLLVALLIAVFAPLSAAQDQPNVLLVFLDNFGWGEPGFNGGGIIRGTATPRMDRLAAEGLRLTNFNVEVQCTPSRSALMTGRYAVRSGNAKVPVGEGEYGLVQWERTLPELLSERGYATGMFGKWHLGRTPGRFPTDQGFDEWYGIPNSTDEAPWTSLPGFAESGVEPPYVYQATKGGEVERVRVYDVEHRPLIDGDLTAKAIDFMQRQVAAETPFFVYLPYTATHFPPLPHPDFAGKTGNGGWADLLLQIDTYLGRLVDAVETLGVAENTIVIFTADNGPEALPAGQSVLTVEQPSGGTAGPWRGTLFTGYEGALRVPFAIRWPGKIPAGTASDEIVHAMDLLPTLCAFTGAEVPSDRPIDGVDQSAFFTGAQSNSNREGFVVYMGDQIYGVKWRNWKLHFKQLETWASSIDDYGMPKIYDLLNDPGETQDVLFPNTWVPRKALVQLAEHAASLREHPPIPMGAPDPYEPK